MKYTSSDSTITPLQRTATHLHRKHELYLSQKSYLNYAWYSYTGSTEDYFSGIILDRVLQETFISTFYRQDILPVAQPPVSKHWSYEKKAVFY